MKRLERQAEKIRSMYFDQRMTQTEIAIALDSSQHAIFMLMKRHNMKARHTGKREQRGAKCSVWRGDAVGYKGAHNRVSTARGKPQQCQGCGTTDPNRRYEWANLTGNYHDPNDYVRLCRSCHCKSDKRERNLGGHAERQGVIHRRE